MESESIVDYLKSSLGKPWLQIAHQSLNGSNGIDATPDSKPENQMQSQISNNNNHINNFVNFHSTDSHNAPTSTNLEWDEFYLLVCDICGIIIRPQALEKHLATKHRIEVHATNQNNTSNNGPSEPAASQPLPAKQTSAVLKQQRQQQQPPPAKIAAITARSGNQSSASNSKTCKTLEITGRTPQQLAASKKAQLQQEQHQHQQQPCWQPTSNGQHHLVGKPVVTKESSVAKTFTAPQTMPLTTPLTSATTTVINKAAVAPTISNTVLNHTPTANHYINNNINNHNNMSSSSSSSSGNSSSCNNMVNKQQPTLPSLRLEPARSIVNPTVSRSPLARPGLRLGTPKCRDRKWRTTFKVLRDAFF